MSSFELEDLAPKPKPAAKTAAQRQAEYRARKGRPLTVYLPDDVYAELHAYMRRQVDAKQPLATLSDAIVKVLRSQLLRKR